MTPPNALPFADEWLERPPRWQRALRLLALPLSLAFHVLLAWFLFQDSATPPEEKETWVEMTVMEPEPEPAPEPPPPEPEPEPEPPPPEPKPEPAPAEPVAFEDTVPEEQAPPPDPRPRRRPVRKVQGLSATSFAPGAGTSLSVRAGTTTGVQATDEVMAIEDATGFDPLPVATVTTQPRNCSHPPVEVPEAAIEAGWEGTVRMRLALDERGRVVGVRVLDRPGLGVEEACRAAARKIRCRPARQNGEPVPVTGMPHRCTIKAID